MFYIFIILLYICIFAFLLTGSPAVQSPSKICLLFSKGFLWPLYQTNHEINPKGLGNLPRDVPGYHGDVLLPKQVLTSFSFSQCNGLSANRADPCLAVGCGGRRRRPPAGAGPGGVLGGEEGEAAAGGAGRHWRQGPAPVRRLGRRSQIQGLGAASGAAGAAGPIESGQR